MCESGRTNTKMKGTQLRPEGRCGGAEITDCVSGVIWILGASARALGRPLAGESAPVPPGVPVGSPRRALRPDVAYVTVSQNDELSPGVEESSLCVEESSLHRALPSRLLLGVEPVTMLRRVEASSRDVEGKIEASSLTSSQ